MKIRRFFGKDMREALSQVKAELGSDAVIMSNRKLADGIELVAAYDKEPEAKLSIKKPAPSAAGRAKAAVPSLSEIIGDDGPDSLKALLEKQHGGSIQSPASAPSANAQHANKIASHLDFSEAFIDDVEASQVASEFPSHQASSLNESIDNSSAPQSDELSQIKEELASLRNVLQYQVADLMEAKSRRQQPVHHYLIQRLTDMGLSQSLAEQLISYTPSHYNERDAWVYLLNLLANRINVTGNDILTQKGAVALVGPTGTGKTTTVAKLAARYAQKYGADSVAMITIDTYRIAAFEQYNQYEPIEGNFVNGRNSLGENIGDVGGLSMAYHAYKLSLNGEEAPVIDGLTGDQRFFLAWAQVWREKRTEESMLNQLRGGTHAPGRYRAQAPRNHDAWYEAFNVQPGDDLYLPPEERVRIW